MTAGLIVLLVVAGLVLLTLGRTIRIIPQAKAGVVERLGRYSRTLTPGLTIVVPFIDKVRPLIDLREQVVTFPPQAIEQLTVTTLRNIIGSLTLEETLTSRDQVNDKLRVVLDERTGKWGIRINGVELKSIDPPQGIQE